jgi:phosphomannomutase
VYKRQVLSQVEDTYSRGALSIDHTDGISIEHPDWRMNLRSSNTEPLIRLNLETRGDPDLLAEKTRTILNFIDDLER